MFAKLFGKAAPDADAPEIAHEDLEQAIKSGQCLVIDVREPHEFAGGHVPGAVNQPLSRFDPKSLPENQRVVLICLSGMRSGNALSKARAAGNAHVRHYPGGMKGWRARGGSVV